MDLIQEKGRTIPAFFLDIIYKLAGTYPAALAWC